MERGRRDTSSQEKSLWENPCDYDTNSVAEVPYSPSKAKEVALQAKNAFETSSKYKDKISKLHSYASFDMLLADWTGSEWLRNFSEALPKEKILNQAMPDEFMKDLMGKIDTVLPEMYKGLKMVVAGLHAISKNGLDANIAGDASLKQNFTETMHNVRAVLCLFNELMRSRKLQISPLPEEVLPKILQDQGQSHLDLILLVYRDTLNYLEYLSQVFQKMNEVNPPMAS